MALDELAKKTGNWDYLRDRPLIPRRVYKVHHNHDLDQWYVVVAWSCNPTTWEIYSLCSCEQEAKEFVDELNNQGDH